MLELFLYPLFKKFVVYCLPVCPFSPSIRQSVHPMIAQFGIFVVFFLGTALQGFLKFGFRVYISHLYRVTRFQIQHSTISYLPNTYIYLHMVAKFKIFVALFSGTSLQGFLKFGFRVYASQLYRVMRFQISTQQLPVYRILTYFYTIKIIHLRRGIISEQ